MRPQHDAAENHAENPARIAALNASMRPQHDAAENPGAESAAGGPGRGFNEAAA